MNILSKRSRTGFTLVEILVVLAIIAVLAALSLAAFSGVREKGRAATCQSNLKQIALATQQYTQDYNGQFPPYNYAISTMLYSLYWYDFLHPYLKTKSVLWCPSNRMTNQLLPTYEYNLFELNNIFNTPKKPSTFVGAHESVFASASDVMLNQDQWGTDEDRDTTGGTLIQTS